MMPYYGYPYPSDSYNPESYVPGYMQPGMPYPYMMYPYTPYNYESDGETDLLAPPRPGDPPPILSDRPAQIRITAFKELTGYPNYGNPSGNADILYTGNTGQWTILIPPQLFVTGNYRAQLVIRGVLDDHSSVPERQYSATISINGSVVHRGRVPLEHGRPAGQRFTNWRELTFNVPNLRRSNRVQIVNTSNTGDNDWIGLDWMEMRLIPR